MNKEKKKRKKMNKILVSIIIFVLLIGGAIGTWFVYKYYDNKATAIPTEEYKYAVVGKIAGQQAELDFMILNITGMKNLTNTFDIFYEGKTDEFTPKIATIHYRLYQPYFIFGKDRVCYYSKTGFPGFVPNQIYELDCGEGLTKIGNLNISYSEQLKGGDNTINFTLTSDGHINGPAICIPDWSFNIITADFPQLQEITNIGNLSMLPCYQYSDDIVNGSVTTKLHYKAFETDELDYIHLVIVDMDRRINDIGMEVSMFFYEGEDIGMENIQYRVK